MKKTTLTSDSEQLPTVRYSSESPLSHPLELIRGSLKDIWGSRGLAFILFKRDLKARFRQTYLGYIWLFLPLFATTFIWFFLNSQKIVNIAETPIPYAAYVMVGAMIWQTFTQSLNAPLQAFNAGKSVFTKLKVAPEAFMLAAAAQIIFDLSLKMLALVPVFIILDISLASTAWLFPVGLACTILLGVSIGLLLVPIGSLYGDVIKIVGQGTNLAMYLTPVVYPPPNSGLAAAIVEYNPLTPFIMAPREWLTEGIGSYTEQLVSYSVGAMLLLFIGIIVFRITLPRLIERMGM